MSNNNTFFKNNRQCITYLNRYHIKKIIIKTSYSKDAFKFTKEDEEVRYSDYVDWAGDINNDGLIDLLLANSESSGSSGYIQFKLFANCGNGQYKYLLDKDFSNLEMTVVEAKSPDANSWKKFKISLVAGRDDLGCDEERGLFYYPAILTFDGKKYSISKAEAAENEKKIKAEVERIKKSCAKEQEKN